MGSRLGPSSLLLVALAACGNTSKAPATAAHGGRGGAESGSAGGANAGLAGAAGLAGVAGSSLTLPEGGAGGIGGGTALCPRPLDLGPGLAARTIGPSGGAHDGPATVERSTEQELLLYFETPAVGSAGLVVRRTLITARHRLPILPPGARLWLRKEPAGEPTPVPFPEPTSGTALSVRDVTGGRLLLGMQQGASAASASAPVPIGAVTDGCVEHNASCTSEDAQLIHQSVELLGDEPVTVPDGETYDLRLAGIDYEAQVWAARHTSGTGKGCFPGASAEGGYLEVQLLAKEPELVTTELPLGAPPACSNGNDVRVETSFALYNVSNGAGFVGKVLFRGQDAELRPGSFLFDLPDLADEGNGPPFLSLLTTTGTFAAPAPQRELWLDMPDLNVQALRESEQGALVLATVHGMRAQPGSEPERAALIRRVLGFAVAPQRRCDYAELDEGPEALWDLLLQADAETEVVARSGERTPLTLDGKRYEVWVDGYSSLSFSIYPAP